MKKQNNIGEIITDEVIRSPHKKRENLPQRKKDRFEEGIKIWTSFYRLNLHRFCQDYLGLNLYPFQMIMLYLMNVMYSCCFVCARGLSKSYTTAIFLCARAILYPGQLIVVSCCTKEQSRSLVREKISKELMKQSPNLRKEIKDIKVGTNETCVYFKNGSTILAINASENTRGLRCHILLVDKIVHVKPFLINDESLEEGNVQEDYLLIINKFSLATTERKGLILMNR